MIIWRYDAPRGGGEPPRAHYGVPVQIHVPGVGATQAVYQFGDGVQACAVVHFASGKIIAHIKDRHHRRGGGYVQEVARIAWAEKLASIPDEILPRIGWAVGVAPVLNTLPKVYSYAM